MSAIITWLEAVFENLPPPLLEVWGRFAYIVGLVLAFSAFGGLTLRPGGRWGLGRQRQAWDAKAVVSIPITFIAIVLTGYVGSSIVLVPGAQTFESLKDLVVFLCIALFGYPALITVPFAYGLSDLIEGVPPKSLLDWLPGYFINPACFWVAYWLFGKAPDFRRIQIWGRYLLFVLIFMSIEPVLWGYICASDFGSAISFGNITPALFFTTSITWIIAPFAMLGAFPLVRKLGLFWAEIPGHVKERVLGRKEWTWVADAGSGHPEMKAPEGWPIRMVLLTPFILLVLLMVGTTAYVTLRSASDDGHKLATRLHQEISANINLQLDDYLGSSPSTSESATANGVAALLKKLPVSRDGVALVINRAGSIVASSTTADHPVATKAVLRLRELSVSDPQFREGFQFRFDHVTEKPLSREIWLARATSYQDRWGGHADWILVTLMPESFYLAGVQAGNSRSAMVFAFALLLSLGVAALLAAMVTNPLRRISQATQALAQGNLDQRTPGSRMMELDTLASSFNDMAQRLKNSFAQLKGEIELRKQTEASLRMMQFSVDHAGDSIFWINRAGQILYVNDAACEGRGYSREEILRMKIFELNPGYSPETLEQTFRALQKQGSITLESQHRTKDGTVFPVEISANYVSLGDQEFTFSAVRDITQRKQSETALRASEERFHSLIENASIAIQVSRSGMTIYANGKFREMFCFEGVEELVGKSPFEQWAPEFRGGLEERSQRRLEDPTATECHEARGQRKDGSQFPMEVFISVVHLPDGPASFATFVDITARKHAETALHASEERYRRIVETAQEGIFVFDAAWRLSFANARFAEILGYTKEEMIGKHLDEFTVPEDRAVQARRARASAGVRSAYENCYRAKNGAAVWLLISASPIMKGETFAGSFGMATDITERKRAEREIADSHAQLRLLAAHLQKVREEESRRIARAVHDEVGQLLTGLKMDLRWIEQGLEKLSASDSNTILEKVVAATELVDEVVTTVQRIAAELRPAILDQLGLFAALRQETIQFQKRAGIECRFILPNPEPKLSPDLATTCYRITQEALTNVARHAEATSVEIEFQNSSEKFVLEIRDNGRGIARDAVKDVNAHGLLGMLERARPHGGDVIIEPRSERGTVVRAHFPRSL